jgi:uncharacterized protein (TIGR01655 family)
MKKNKFCIIIIVLAVLLIAGAIWGKQYYDSRYIGKTYYTIVPANQNTTPEPIYNMHGSEQVGTGVKYSLTAYNEQGEAKTVDFTVMQDDKSIPQPGTYLSVNASEQIVLKWSVVDENSIPEKALEKIKANP